MLKAGKPWVGAVKNRRKDGKFYWVLATASPIRENGQVVGYTSVRTKLLSDQRAEAEQVYAAIREKGLTGYKIDDGIIRRTSMFDRLSVFTSSLGARLTTLMSVQALFLASAGMTAAFASGSAAAGVAVVGVVVSTLLGLRVQAVMSAPLKHLNETMVNIVNGKLDNRIRIERHDEVGQALRNLQTVQTVVRFSGHPPQAGDVSAREQLRGRCRRDRRHGVFSIDAT